MVRNYKRKNQEKINETIMTSALRDVLIRKQSIRGTALKYLINHNTLFKRVKLAKKSYPPMHQEDSGNESEDNLTTSKSAHHRQVFSINEEEELKKYLLRSSQINYGLTYVQTQNLAYQYAQKLGKSYPGSWDLNRAAGRDWMYGYMKRHPELSLRKPENTSLARATAFNATNVGEFFNNYVTVLERYKFNASKIFNLDETGITTVMQAPKVIADKSKRQVGQIVSGERGELVTFTAIVNAAGNSLPPVFIFPRVRYKEQFLQGAPTESLGIASKTGWITVELFPEVLKHIQKHSQCTKDNPILLLMDNHNSHCSLPAIDFARMWGIVLLSFPPHCSHKLQPLDVGIFGPFKSALKVAFNDYLLTHPGKLITIYDIPQLAKRAYESVFVSRNIISAFGKPGIWPLNRLAFDDNDFAASYVTDRPYTQPDSNDAAIPDNQLVTNAAIIPIIPMNTSNTAIPDTNPATSDAAISYKQTILQHQIQKPSTSRDTPLNSVALELIKPYPKAELRKKRQSGRERGKSRIFTDTPEKTRIELINQANHDKRYRKRKPSKPAPPEELDETSESETLIDLPDSDDCSIFSENDENFPNLLVDSDISECAAKGGECDETKGRPVCGTDNQTYPTRCHLIRAQCSGHKVSVKYRGKCKAECLASRGYALTHKSIFIPRCRVDGSYAPVQCGKENTGCWCVNSQGKPIPNTTVITGKPTCIKPEKSNKRRSSPRNDQNLDGAKKQCTKIDRFQFNTNLIKIFHSEYTRYHSSPSYPSTVTDKIVLDWKFSTLDTNNNHLLDKNEYRELKRIVKKAVKPKRCARTFGKFCDRDHDDRLSRQEWGSCLSKDANHTPDSSSSTINLPSLSSSPGNQNHHGGGGGGGGGGGNGGNRNRQKNNHHQHHNIDDFEDESIDNDDDQDDDDDYGDMSETDFHRGGLTSNIPGARVKPVFLLHNKPTLDLGGENDRGTRESDGESDCLADRTAALDEQKAGTQALYVPDCTPDGRYHRVQCYRSTGYCWCVHEDTGKNIPGTSTKDQRPQCDAIVQLTRPMKGCPDDKKIEFLKELKNFLKTQLITSTSTGSEPTNWKTEDEKIATLSFVILDKNKNKVWERSEWKPFRDSITSVKKLRKCGKKMPRYCDVNNDRKITLSEWMNCLETQRVPTVTPKIVSNNESKPTTFTTKLKGPNPLESYLKSDR